MDSLLQAEKTLASLMAAVGEQQLMLILAVLFAGVALAVVAVGSLVLIKDRARARMLAGGAAAAGQPGPATLRHTSGHGAWDQLLDLVGRNIVPGGKAESSQLRLRLVRAGYAGPSAVRSYYAARILLAAALPLVFLMIAPFAWSELDAQTTLLIAAGLTLIGLYLPYRWVQHKMENRQRALAEAFPDALDMLVVCVEGGLSLDAAFSRVGAQMTVAHPVLAEAFAAVSLALNAGKSREQALRDLAERTGVDDIRSFVTILVQSDRMGASIAQTLRVQADEMRSKRMLRAEEMAHKLPVKLVFPLVLCILPAMLAAVLLPGIIGIVRNILPHLGN